MGKELELGQKIIKAIVEHDEDFYEEYICKHTQYPDEEADKYWDGEQLNPNESYDNDVDRAEMQAVIDLLQFSITNHHPHKVGGQ
tara:strand:+ start:274 stop:528 length:255 start_codon:yes stop_codon:yes gene_type:complete